MSAPPQNGSSAKKLTLNPNAPVFSAPSFAAASISNVSSTSPAPTSVPSASSSASASASKSKLNPKAAEFKFNPAASSFVPTFAPSTMTSAPVEEKSKSSPVTSQNPTPASSSTSQQHQKEESKEQVSSPSNGNVKEISESPVVQEDSQSHFEPVVKNGRKTYTLEILEEIRKLVSPNDTVEVGVRDVLTKEMSSSSSSRYDNKPHQRRYNNDKDAPTRDQFGTAVMKDQRRNNQGRNNPRQQKDAPLDIEVKPLVDSENRYRILKDIPADVQVVRGVTSILNKLTPEKFDILVERVLELEINSEALLRDVVSTVFEKAINEPNYSPTYADFCQKLMAKLPAFAANEQDEKKSSNFKRLILNLCQQEFEKDEAKKQEEREKLATLSEDDRLEAEFTMKRRRLGMIRFIGELFARQILAAPIMLRCVQELLGDPEDPNEEQIESLCKLLGVVGKLLEQKNSSFIADTFTKLDALTSSTKLSSRIRFMIQNTQEMKERGWQGRGQTEEARKVSELRAEEEKKQTTFEKEKKPAKKAAFGKGDRYFAAAAAPKKKTVVSEDGEWMTTTTTKSKGGKWKDTRGAQDVRRAASPKRSTSSNTSRNTQEGKESQKELSQRNAYAFLEEDVEDNEDNEELSEPLESPSAGVSESEPEEATLNRIEHILREFLSTQDKAEVSLSVKELIEKLGAKSSQLSYLISHSYKVSVGESSAKRQLTNEFVAYLVEQGLVDRAQLIRGLDRTMEKLVDWAMDLPVLGDELGSLVATLIHKQYLPFSYLSSSGFEPVYQNENDTDDLAKLFRSVFRHLLQLSDAADKEATLVQSIKSVNLDLVKSMPSYDRTTEAAVTFYVEDKKHGVSALSSLLS